MRMNEVVQYILAGIIVIAAVVAVVRSIICAERGCKALETAFHTQIEVHMVIVTFFPDIVVGFCL